VLYHPIMTIAFRRDLEGFKADKRGYVDLSGAYFLNR